MTFRRRQLLRLAAGAAALAAVPRIATGETYPARPVRVIVPLAPGGPTDVFARLMAQKLSEQMGVQFYVENIAGAGGNIGAGRAAQSTPDGYTILVNGANHVVNPALYQRVPYDPAKDFDPVTLAVTAPAVLTVNPTLPVDTVRDPSRQIQLRLAGRRYAAASRWRVVPPVARPRPRSRPIQRRRPGDRLGGRGSHADFVRLDGAGRAAGQRRAAAGAGGLDQDALAGAARRSHHDGGRISRRCGRIVVRRPRAGGNAQGHHRAAAAGDRASHHPAGHAGAPGDARLRAGRQHA